MIRHTMRVCTLGFVLLCLAGCQTSNDVIREKTQGGGTTRVYPVSMDQAWEIAKTVFRGEGSDAIEEHKAEGYMLTSSGLKIYTAGAVMGAWVVPINERETKVTVITKRRMVTNLFTGLQETKFHERFAQAVEVLKAGKPLPVTPPE